MPQFQCYCIDVKSIALNAIYGKVCVVAISFFSNTFAIFPDSGSTVIYNTSRALNDRTVLYQSKICLNCIPLYELNLNSGGCVKISLRYMVHNHVHVVPTPHTVGLFFLIPQYFIRLG
jgi:hypothetical protein